MDGFSQEAAEHAKHWNSVHKQLLPQEIRYQEPVAGPGIVSLSAPIEFSRTWQN